MTKKQKDAVKVSTSASPVKHTLITSSVDVKLNQADLADLIQTELMDAKYLEISKELETLSDCILRLKEQAKDFLEQAGERVKKNMTVDPHDMLIFENPRMKITSEDVDKFKESSLFSEAVFNYNKNYYGRAEERIDEIKFRDNYTSKNGKYYLEISSRENGSVLETLPHMGGWTSEGMLRTIREKENKNDESLIDEDDKRVTLGLEVILHNEIEYEIPGRIRVTVNIEPDAMYHEMMRMTGHLTTIKSSMTAIWHVKKSVSALIKEYYVLKKSKPDIKLNITRQVLESTDSGKDLLKLIGKFRTAIKGDKLLMEVNGDKDN